MQLCIRASGHNSGVICVFVCAALHQSGHNSGVICVFVCAALHQSGHNSGVICVFVCAALYQSGHNSGVICVFVCAALHQSGHNSGVVHMGMYYKPGSLKAKLCVEGAEMMYNYLDSKGLPYKKCGKVIVAVDEDEVPLLKNLYIRACANRCKDIKMITAEELKQLEPHCNVCGMLYRQPGL